MKETLRMPWAVCALKFSVNDQQVCLTHYDEKTCQALYQINVLNSYESSLLKIRQYADSLPGQVSDFFGFECPLAANDHAVDLLFCSTQLEGHAKILAGQHRSISMPEKLLQMPAWQKVREFCIDWENPSSGLYK